MPCIIRALILQKLQAALILTSYNCTIGQQLQQQLKELVPCIQLPAIEVYILELMLITEGVRRTPLQHEFTRNYRKYIGM